MGAENFDDIIDVPFNPRRPSTAETVATLELFQDRSRSSVRITTGRIMEDDVFKQEREKELKKPLP